MATFFKRTLFFHLLLSRFEDDQEIVNIQIPLLNDFDGKETSFWVELYGQEKGVALGLRRTKVIIIRDEGLLNYD